MRSFEDMLEAEEEVDGWPNSWPGIYDDVVGSMGGKRKIAKSQSVSQEAIVW